MPDLKCLSRSDAAPEWNLAGVKVLHVCESLPGGPASYLQEILPQQRTVLGEECVAVLAPEQQLNHLGAAAPQYVWGYERKGRDLGSLLALRRALKTAVAQFCPDIVHLHSSFAGAVGRLTLSRGAGGAKILYCAHGWAFDDDRETKFQWPLAAIERWLASRTDVVINISPHEMGLLARRGFPAERVRLVVSGLGDEEATAVTPARNGERVTLLFVGRFDRQKGLDLLLAEMARLENQDIRLMVAGANVVARSQLGELPTNVVPLGWIDRSKIPELMASVDAVIMPSRWEGMPLVALEALRAGRPLLASRRGAFCHIITEGETGLLLDIEQPGFLHASLKKVSRSELVTMGKAAREAYENSYTSARMNNEIIGLYQELCRRETRSI